jgi:hypothetical protein
MRVLSCTLIRTVGLMRGIVMIASWSAVAAAVMLPQRASTQNVGKLILHDREKPTLHCFEANQHLNPETMAALQGAARGRQRGALALVHDPQRGRPLQSS